MRRPAVEAFLIEKGIIQVLLDIINDQDAVGNPKWQPSLRDVAGMFLGELMTEHEMIVKVPNHQEMVQNVQIAMLSLMRTGNARLEVRHFACLACFPPAYWQACSSARADTERP